MDDLTLSGLGFSSLFVAILSDQFIMECLFNHGITGTVGSCSRVS